MCFISSLSKVIALDFSPICFSSSQYVFPVCRFKALPHTLHINLLLSSMSPPGQCCPTSEGSLWLLCCARPDLGMALELILTPSLRYIHILGAFGPEAHRFPGYQEQKLSPGLFSCVFSNCITGFGGVRHIWNYIYTAAWSELPYALATRTEPVGRAWTCLQRVPGGDAAVVLCR